MTVATTADTSLYKKLYPRMYPRKSLKALQGTRREKREIKLKTQW